MTHKNRTKGSDSAHASGCGWLIAVCLELARAVVEQQVTPHRWLRGWATVQDYYYEIRRRSVSPTAAIIQRGGSHCRRTQYTRAISRSTTLWGSPLRLAICRYVNPSTCSSNSSR